MTMESGGKAADKCFEEAWHALAAQGRCDGHGGCEYGRVRAEWERAGRPSRVATFIVRRANLGPEGEFGEQGSPA